VQSLFAVVVVVVGVDDDGPGIALAEHFKKEDLEL
jgi:hypothetical protein